ncbi:transmembrane protein [Cavenderia fasciculata]|uniref:Phospholipid-transporting ATPase n=1 Tax=Cavenderia fasciculata TaxID=261658 RepID=F4Q9I3_CACFS|nr:uncharacterized protein DFA_10186 [Cavenderia fasciculata]EGG15352.1 transmembrane protein [Cavenderia fasciculata]|eukprot:XP_004354094.1 transmembrane protein [Cavenderia fasciculata]
MSIFRRSKPKPENGVNNCYSIFLNDPKMTFTQGRKYPSNYIRTTKYTLLTFIPKNLFEQFRRMSNFYFLCVLVVQCIPQISPLIPLTSILPLSFVLLITAIKEALEDYGRYQSDQKNNREVYNIVKNGQLLPIYSKDLRVGDIVKISNTQRFPADMVLLASTNEEGLCYVETSNLDGETNLKVRKSLSETNGYQTLEEISTLRGSVVYETPNERLYRFNGRFVQQGQETSIVSLNHTMFLQRGSQLRNTKSVFAVCVYTGVDTKLYLNQQPPPSKFSTVERLLNRLILYTGTLTENDMRFCKCSVGLDVFDERENTGGLATSLAAQASVRSSRIQSFLRVLSLCHTVVSELEEATGNITYQSQSPDELALVQTARNNGYFFVNRKSDEIIVRENGVDTAYALLAILEFSSARRRMSVIVRTPEGGIKLLCKGADMAISCRLTSRDRHSYHEETLNYLKIFSREGLRTLMLAERDLTQDEFDEWKHSFLQATTSLDNREERVEAVCELIEKDMVLVGTTAIEDRLQCHVPETISYLLEAGMHIWVLTGDKQETAVNIGYSCRLFDPAMELIFVNTETSEECGQILDRYIALLPPEIEERTGLLGFIGGSSSSNNNKSAAPSNLPGALNDQVIAPQLQLEYGLVIDGNTLAFALADHKDKFLRLGRACKSVICCRVTPLQKALVVRVVKESEKKISLAIGDGANDVSMIQEAHVGIGIYGKEGTQAARASDYSIHQFSHLKRLLCVHGRFSSLFTGQTIFDSWIITFYNILFTSLPPFFYGLFERDIDEESIMENPQIYRRLQSSPLLTRRSFFLWIIAGIWHSLVVYFSVRFLFDNDIVNSNGLTAGIWSYGTLISTSSILIANLRMALEVRTWNIFTGIGLAISLLSYFVMLMFYAYFLPLSPNMYDIFSFELKTITFHLVIIISVFIALVPDFVIKYYKWQYHPLDVQILTERRGIKQDIQLTELSSKRAQA